MTDVVKKLTRNTAYGTSQLVLEVNGHLARMSSRKEASGASARHGKKGRNAHPEKRRAQKKLDGRVK